MIRKLCSIRNTRLFRPLIWVLLLAFVIIPASSLAETAPPAPGHENLGWGNKLKSWNEICSLDVANKENKQLTVFYVVVTCFETVIDGLAEQNILEFSNFIRDAVYVAMMLAVILFGGKVLTGITAGEKLKSEFIIVLLKIAFIGWLVFNFGLVEMWQMTLGIYQSALNLVLSPADIPECPMDGSDLSFVWITMDCLISKMLGFSEQNGFGSSWQGVSIFGLVMGAKLFENTAGGFMFAIFASAIISIIMAFARMAFIYMLSMVGLILMFTISPLVIPLMLFSRTQDIFRNWYQIIISLIMQVVIMFAFFAFSANIIYQLIFEPGGLQDIYQQLKFSNDVSSTTESGTQSVFDMVTSMASSGANGTMDDKTKDLLFSMVSIMILGFLILSFLQFIGEMARELAGSAKTPSLQNQAPGMMAPGAKVFK